MTDQPDLFSPAPPYSEPTTSKAAADSIAAGSAIIRERVYEHLVGLLPDGAIEQEMEFTLGLHGNTLRPRLWELERAGRVVKADETRLTMSGRAARVYKAVP